MIGAGDGTGNYGKGGHWVGGYHGRGRKEVARQHGCHACVLHAHFNGERPTLGGVESECLSSQIAQQIAGTVVEGDNSQCKQDKLHSPFPQLGMYGEDDTAHNAGQAQHADAGHNALYLLKVLPFAQKVVEGYAQCNGNERHQQDVLKHTPCIHLNLRTGQPKHKQGRHKGRKTGADGCHAHAICHITLAEEAHEVAAHTARTATNQNDACSHECVQMKKTGQHPCHNRHNGVLRYGADKDVYRAGKQDAEVLGGECASHRQHDKPKNDRSPLPLLHPCKGIGRQEGNDGNDDDE